MSTFICPHCGKPHRITAKFCPSTGNLLVQRVQQPSLGVTGRLPPQTVLNNRYVIVQKAGRGGMGAVYQATDIRLHGQVWAIKEMSESMIAEPQERAQAVKSFQQEANILANLNHPNLPRVVDSFSEGGRHYLAMEYVQGKNLEEIIEQHPGPYRESEILPWVVQLCDVLTYLHNQPQPIIFRDLKPDNIMVTHQGQIKLIDFGIVRFFKPGKSKDTMAFGTLGYCAPEASRGQTDGRSDLYSLCIVIHEMLTRHDPTTTLFKLPFMRQLNPNISHHWERIVHRGLQNERNHRWRDVEMFKQELLRAGGGPNASEPMVYSPPVVVGGNVRTSRPTKRLVMVASQLSPWQLAAALIVAVVITIGGLWWLAPILRYEYTLIWNNLPMIAMVAPMVYAAAPRPWLASISHGILAFVGGMTVYLRLGGDENVILLLIIGALLSGALIEVWLRYTERVKGSSVQDNWKRELAWYCGMEVLATALLYQIAFGLGFNPGLWLGSALMAALGWFLGDLVRQYLNFRQTGSRRV